MAVHTTIHTETSQDPIAHRDLVVTDPPMRGRDVANLNRAVHQRLEMRRIDIPSPVHDMFTQAAALAAVEAGYFLGLLEDTILATDSGRRVCTQGAQTIIREPERRTAEQLERAKVRHPQAASGPRYYAELSGGGVAVPVDPILEHSNGFNGGHDGVDLICEADDVVYAICDAKVIDVRSGGWWGKGAQASHGHPIAHGDGIIQIECVVDQGPFKKGLHFGYGHAEKAVVKVGQTVKAGQKLGHAGFANAWHLHFMVNGGTTMKGIGDRNPMPFVDFAKSH
jgi:murein DD-endopeptidase MepM/ murein hydrolase activator NlpD